MALEPSLLEVDGLTIRLAGHVERPSIVDDLSIGLGTGEIVGLVGESGCGKSVSALSLLGLLPASQFETTGRISFDGEDFGPAEPSRWREVRGRLGAMIFQDPMSSLNPAMRCGRQIEEVLRFRLGMSRASARRRCLELMGRVGIPAPENRHGAWPHELSGGLRQRVMIAMALASEPRLLIADEPTTALDVTLQAQILDLLADLRQREGLAVLLISHDLGVVARLADRILVMYAGQVIEQAPADKLLAGPRHPYTRALIAAVPDLDVSDPVRGIDGAPPPPGQRPPGCRFRPRCPIAVEGCGRRQIMLSVSAGHQVRCHKSGDG